MIDSKRIILGGVVIYHFLRILAAVQTNHPSVPLIIQHCSVFVAGRLCEYCCYVMNKKYEGGAANNGAVCVTVFI